MEPPNCTRYNYLLYWSNLLPSFAHSNSTLYRIEPEVTVV